MDKTDIVLSMLLLNNSRVSYRQLADKLDLSMNAVHRRIQSLIDSGIIHSFTARINLGALRAMTAIVYGKSESDSLSTVHEKLGTQGSIYWVALAGGNQLYVGAYLKNISELEPLTDYVRKEALMPNPTVGILPSPSSYTHAVSVEESLYPLDWQIIWSIHDNSRKPVAEIAEELGVAAKTVRRRLTAMIKKGLMELSMKWYPDVSNDIMSIIHVRLKPTAEKNVANDILKRYFPTMLFYFSFVNIPNELVIVVWTNTMKELREFQRHLAGEETVASMVSNILYAGYIFDTWRDKLVCENLGRMKKT
jgi:DNA-binding Lrp family transcriptional regulator